MNNGHYRAKGVDVTLAEKNKKQFIEILFEIQEGPSKGERISVYGYFVGGATDITLDMMRLCGWDSGQDIKGVLRNVVEIEVYEETYDGKTSQKAKVVRPRAALSTREQNRMTSAQARDFLDSLCAPAPPNGGNGKSVREPGEEDDLPY